MAYSAGCEIPLSLDTLDTMSFDFHQGYQAYETLNRFHDRCVPKQFAAIVFGGEQGSLSQNPPGQSAKSQWTAQTIDFVDRLDGEGGDRGVDRSMICLSSKIKAGSGNRSGQPSVKAYLLLNQVTPLPSENVVDACKAYLSEFLPTSTQDPSGTSQRNNGCDFADILEEFGDLTLETDDRDDVAGNISGVHRVVTALSEVDKREMRKHFAQGSHQPGTLSLRYTGSLPEEIVGVWYGGTWSEEYEDGRGLPKHIRWEQNALITDWTAPSSEVMQSGFQVLSSSTHMKDGTPWLTAYFKVKQDSRYADISEAMTQCLTTNEAEMMDNIKASHGGPSEATLPARAPRRQGASHLLYPATKSSCSSRSVGATNNSFRSPSVESVVFSTAYSLRPARKERTVKGVRYGSFWVRDSKRNKDDPKNKESKSGTESGRTRK